MKAIKQLWLAALFAPVMLFAGTSVPNTPAAVFNLQTREVRVTWLHSGESFLAGFKIYYGLQSRFPSRPEFTAYDNVHDVPTVTTVTIIADTFTENVTYYFTVTAYSTTDGESGFSEEISLPIPPIVEPPAGGVPHNPVDVLLSTASNVMDVDTLVVGNKEDMGLEFTQPAKFDDLTPFDPDSVDYWQITIRNIDGTAEIQETLMPDVIEVDVQLYQGTFTLDVTAFYEGRESLPSEEKYFRYIAEEFSDKVIAIALKPI